MKENFYSYISPTISTIMLALVVLNLKPLLRHSRLFLLWPRPGLHDTIFYNRSSLPLIRLQITSRHWFRYISQDSNNSAAQTVSTGMLWRCWSLVCHIKKKIQMENALAFKTKILQNLQCLRQMYFYWIVWELNLIAPLCQYILLFFSKLDHFNELRVSGWSRAVNR